MREGLQVESVARRGTRSTRLQQVIDALGLTPLSIVYEARRLAEILRRPAISRQHFGRIRSGRAIASEEKIFIIVGAMRAVTGLLFRPQDLFDIDPPLVEEMAVFSTLVTAPVRATYGSNASAPVFSDSRTSRVWRLFVSQESGSIDPFESLYIEYGLLLRTIAMRRYHVPPDDAEALVHDIFAAYLERRAYVHNARAWLIGAIGNASSNYVRKRMPEVQLLPEHEEAIDRAEEEKLERWMRRLTVAAILARLGDKCREALRRYYLREQSKEAIAAHLDISPGYVLQLLVTCRRRAQKLLRSLARGNQ